MDSKTLLLRANQQLLTALERAVTDLADVHMHYSAPLIDERSLCDVCIHAYRPVLAATAIVVGCPWPARAQDPKTAQALHTLLSTMAAQVQDWLRASEPLHLEQAVTLRWGTYATGAEAILGAITHGFVHTGMIYGIRAMGNFPVPPDAV